MSGYGVNQNCCCEVEPKEYVDSIKAEPPLQASVRDQLNEIRACLTEIQLTLEQIIGGITGDNPPPFNMEEPKSMHQELFSISAISENCLNYAKRIGELLM